MKYRIHFELRNGIEDFIDIEGDSIEEIRESAISEVNLRNGINPWSEELK